MIITLFSLSVTLTGRSARSEPLLDLMSKKRVALIVIICHVILAYQTKSQLHNTVCYFLLINKCIHEVIK